MLGQNVQPKYDPYFLAMKVYALSVPGKCEDPKVSREIASVTTGWAIPEGSLKVFKSISSYLSDQGLVRLG
jgi:hypothetical protein